MADPVILTQAQSEGRIVITFDKDFGELVYRNGAAASAGIVLFRITTRSPEEAADRKVRVVKLPRSRPGN
jgi:predicted nuclease of predicted toxin-antitoxin system